MEGNKIPQALDRAIAVASKHPAVLKVGVPATNSDGSISVELTFQVSLPNVWRAKGQSPSGVKLHEPVRLDFPAGFPLHPPRVSLRQDFGRNFAHIQPWLVDGRPVPCIVYGQVSEFFQQHGMVGILNQTSLWLDHAAEGVLIDQEQGWEPVRRDNLNDYIVADETALRGLVDRKGGYKFFHYEYLRMVSGDGNFRFHGQVSPTQAQFNSETIRKIFREEPRASSLLFGEGLALVVWPGKKPSGELIECSCYSPENVSNFGELKIRATLFGCAKELDDALAWLTRCFIKYSSPHAFSMAIILCARRPFNLIGANSPIEICPYMVDICPPQFSRKETQQRCVLRDIVIKSRASCWLAPRMLPGWIASRGH